MKCREMLGALSDYIDDELEEHLCAAIERRDRLHQPRKLDSRDDTGDRGGENRGDLARGDRRHQQPEGGAGPDIEERPDRQRRRVSLERHVEDQHGHRGQEQEIGERDGDFRRSTKPRVDHKSLGQRAAATLQLSPGAVASATPACPPVSDSDAVATDR